jgi:tetratricopeptide (TPR) repeat protein
MGLRMSAGRHLVSAVIVMLTGVAEAWLTLQLATRPGQLLQLIAVQGFASSVIAVAGALLYRYGERRPVLLLVMTATAALGPLGFAGGVLVFVLRAFFVRRATPFEIWYAELFPAQAHGPARILYDRIALRNAGPPERDSAVPFTDVLELGTAHQKQVVVSLMADHFCPAFTPALRSALNNREPAVRVLAASAAARIENHFAQREAALRQALTDALDDPRALLALARHLASYADTGLMDSGRAADIRRHALVVAEQAAAQAPDSSETAELTGHLLLALGRADEAVERLEPWMRRTDPPEEIAAFYLAGLYELRRFADLREACRRHLDAVPSNLRGIASLWSQSQEVAA